MPWWVWAIGYLVGIVSSAGAIGYANARSDGEPVPPAIALVWPVLGVIVLLLWLPYELGERLAKRGGRRG